MPELQMLQGHSHNHMPDSLWSQWCGTAWWAAVQYSSHGWFAFRAVQASPV